MREGVSSILNGHGIGRGVARPGSPRPGLRVRAVGRGSLKGDFAMDRVATKNSNILQLGVVTAIIAIVAAFYILTIRAGHDWGDDFSMYIHHAVNIVEGKDYDQAIF